MATGEPSIDELLEKVMKIGDKFVNNDNPNPHWPPSGLCEAGQLIGPAGTLLPSNYDRQFTEKRAICGGAPGTLS